MEIVHVVTHIPRHLTCNITD